MSFLAPWMLAGAAAAAAAMVALHFIAWDRPQPSPLPTARFVPEPRDVPAARRLRLVELFLLALRVLTILLIGLAFARPVLAPSRRGSTRIVVLDYSRGVASRAAALDSARAWRRDGDALLVVDSANAERGSLSAALIRAVRTAESTRARPDSSEIVLVSPLLAEEVDDATSSIRQVWPGTVRIVRVAGSQATPVAPGAIEARGTGDDPIVAAARLVPATGRALVVGGALTAADSALAAAGRTVVHWPAARPGGQLDGALVGERTLAVATFIRPAEPVSGNAVPLRWADGAPAAIESRVGSGCIRTVHAGVPEGDAVLRPPFLDLLNELTRPCASHVDPTLAPDAVIARVSGRGESGARADLAAGLPLAPWLFAAAALTALAELIARRRR